MIINQNILAILRTFSNLQKNLMKNFAPKRQLPKPLPLNFSAKFLTERKYLMNEIMKSINSQTNNKSQGNNGLTGKFYKHFSNELAPVLLHVYNSWGKLVLLPMVLLLEQESYLSYMKKVIKKMLQTTAP